MLQTCPAAALNIYCKLLDTKVCCNQQLDRAHSVTLIFEQAFTHVVCTVCAWSLQPQEMAQLWGE